MVTLASITFIARYHGTRLTRTLKLTTARKKYKCSVKGCTHIITPGDLHWTDQTYRVCRQAVHRHNWETDE